MRVLVRARVGLGSGFGLGLGLGLRARVSYGLAAGGALRADAGAGRGCRRRRGRLLKVGPVVEPCVQACGSAARSWYGHAVRSGTSFARLEGAQGAQRGQAALRPRYVQRRREAGTTQPAHVSAQAAGRRRGPQAPRPRRRWTRPAAAERCGRAGAAAQGAHATDSSVNIAQQWAGGASRDKASGGGRGAL